MGAGQREDSGAYRGFERFTGSVHGRSGGFVLHHNASRSAGTGSMSWTVLPDSGSGQLAGISGTGQITVTADGRHHYTLDYELG